MKLVAFIRQNKIRLEHEMVGENPNWSDDDRKNGPWYHYKVVLKRGKKQATFFWTCHAANPNPEPDVRRVLDSLKLDAGCGEDDFETFCGNMGYDSDSRKAERMHKACEETARKMKRFLGDDLYRTLIRDVEGD